jgi:hypothetical protein
MLTLIDLHSELDEELNINNSDSVFSTLFYTDLINTQRSLAVRNEYNKKRSIDPSVQQSFCLGLELVDEHNCCVEVPIGCKILRSVLPIPSAIELHQGPMITSVGPALITKKRFTLIEYSRVPHIGNGRTTGKTVYAFLYDNYIYVISKDPMVKLLKLITVRGVFEDPSTLKEFTNCDGSGSPCWSPSSPYPMKQWMWAYVKPQVVQQLLMKRQMPIDDNNDANDNLADRGTTAK